MNNALDVLILESDTGRAAEAASRLDAAGHRVHRCHAENVDAFPCMGVVDPSACPLVRPIDVTLVAHGPGLPHPTAQEDGVSCAIRAGIPLVEVSEGGVDPFRPWVTRWTTSEGAVAACEAAADDGFVPLRQEVQQRVDALLRRVGVDPALVQTRFVRESGKLVVHITGPGLGPRAAQALSVRVLDGVRNAGRTYGKVNVQVHVAGP